MQEREMDLSVYAEVDTSKGCNQCSSWKEDIPDMPRPGDTRWGAANTYDHIVAEFTQAQEEDRSFTPQDAVTIFQRDVEEDIRTCGEAAWKRTAYNLRNLRAWGIYEAGEEFLKEEAKTPRYQTFQRVNNVLSQAINPPLGK